MEFPGNGGRVGGQAATGMGMKLERFLTEDRKES